MGQRLQRQGDAWQQELKAWIKYQRSASKVVTERVSLGCAILIRFCDLLHADMFRSNSESLEIRNQTRTLPTRDCIDCSLLLSVTDPNLPKQPGGGGVRYWFPPDHAHSGRRARAVGRLGTSLPPVLNSADLEALLEKSSFEDLEKQCKQLQITPFGKLNRLRMAESILFHQSAGISRHQPELKGKVFLSWFVV